MNSSALFRICVRYGLVAGLLTAVLMILLFYIGHHPFLIAPFLDFRIALFGIFIFFSLKEFRDFVQEGILYFWQGLIGSFVVVLLAATVSAIGLYVFGSLEPRFITDYITEMTAYLKTFPPEKIEQLGKDIYERNLSLLQTTNISELVVTYFAQGMVIGLFISLILSVILRKTT